MRTFLLIFSLVLAQFVSAQTFNQTNAQGQKIGQWKKMYSNGKVRYTGQFKNDVPFGVFKYYDENGWLESEITHSANGHSSSIVIYYSNGKIRAKGFYYDQLKDGIWIYYSESTGKPKIQESYKKGVKNGVWKIFFDNGNVFTEITYENDLEHGIWLEYFENGNKCIEAHYNVGKFDGTYSVFNLEGKLLTQGTYKQGIKHGEWSYYDGSGVLVHKEFFREGWMYKEEIYKNGVLVETRKQASKIEEK